MSLCHVDYSNCNNQGPKVSRRNFDLPSNCPKQFRQRACSQIRVITRDIGKEYRLVFILAWWWGKFCRVQRAESTLSHWLCMTQQTVIYQTFGFPSPWELLSSLLKSQITTPNILFCLQLKIVFKVRVLAILVYHFSGSLPCLRVVKLLSDFFSCFFFPDKLTSVSCQF